MNELKLRGKVCQLKKYDWGYKFSINFYAGKDKDDKALYGYIDCKSFKIVPKEGEIIEANGWLSYEKFTYNEKKYSQIMYIVKEITPFKAEKKKEETKNETPDPFDDDDLGF